MRGQSYPSLAEWCVISVGLLRFSAVFRGRIANSRKLWLPGLRTARSVHHRQIVTHSHSGLFVPRGGSSVQRFAESSCHLRSFSMSPILRPLWLFAFVRECLRHVSRTSLIELRGMYDWTFLLAREARARLKACTESAAVTLAGAVHA